MATRRGGGSIALIDRGWKCGKETGSMVIHYERLHLDSLTPFLFLVCTTVEAETVELRPQRMYHGFPLRSNLTGMMVVE